jgi:hypothetical protein
MGHPSLDGPLNRQPMSPRRREAVRGGSRAREPATVSASEASHDERDAMVRAALAQHGDTGVTPRHTLFYFYGDGDHEDLNEVAKRAGFITRGSDDSTVLETTIPVDAESFAPVSAMMQSWAAAFQLDYDGWECAVVTN